MKQYLECGKIVTTHGIRGEVKAEVWMDSPAEMTRLKTVYLEGGKTPLAVQNARVQKNMVILKLAGIETPEAANTYRQKVLWCDRRDVPLREGQYFLQDLIGLTVVDADDGHTYGTLVDTSETGANSVYHIKFADQKIRLIPAIPQVVLEVDIEGGRMLIRPLPGLFDDVTEDDNEV